MGPSPKNTFFFLLGLRLLLLSTFTNGNATTSFVDIGSAAADLTNLNFIGDARMAANHTLIMLTPLTPSRSSVAGGVFYRRPINLQGSVTGIPLSFSTSFSLLITNPNKGRTGGGAAFVVSPDDDRIGGAGESLGVPSGAFSVEFDTKMDGRLGDIDGNHVGVNLGTMVSSKAVGLDSFRIDLRADGRPLNAWIDYDGATQRLKVYVSYRDGRPNKPVLSTRVDLIGRYAKEKHVYVGLTASTQSSTEAHSVGNWSFRSFFVDTGSSPAVQQPPPTTSNILLPVKERRISDRLVGVIVPWGIAAVALVASAAGSIYCIRIRNALCCNDCCNNICL